MCVLEPAIMVPPSSPSLILAFPFFVVVSRSSPPKFPRCASSNRRDHPYTTTSSGCRTARMPPASAPRPPSVSYFKLKPEPSWFQGPILRDKFPAVVGSVYSTALFPVVFGRSGILSSIIQLWCPVPIHVSLLCGNFAPQHETEKRAT